MGGIAAIAKQAGYRVTGCDANVYPPMSTQLEAQGIELIEGFGVEQLALNPDVYVIGNVVTRGNALMEEILNRNLPYASGPQWLSDTLLRDKWVLGVAGTHGKTTTTSMVGVDIGICGADARLPDRWCTARTSASRRASLNHPSSSSKRMNTTLLSSTNVPSSCTTIRAPRFLNNLEFDHADIFADLNAIETQFHHLVRTVPGNGLVVCNGREESLQRVLKRGCWTPVELFGNDAGWQIDADNRVTLNGAAQGMLQWDLMGEHNRMNALAALSAARHVGVPVAQGLAALAEFKNVKRRMEVKGTVKGITVYDDFAHHPTAIDTTVAGLRNKVGKARILAVLEPRSNTMKLGVMKDALPSSLKDADLVFCYAGNLGWDAHGALAPLGRQSRSQR